MLYPFENEIPASGVSWLLATDEKVEQSHEIENERSLVKG